MKNGLTKLFSEFFNSEKAGGFILIGCTVISIVIANSNAGEDYLHFCHKEVGFDSGQLHLQHSIEHWINDGLMAIFFLLVGLEIEQEIFIGELSNFRKASLPIFAAIAGMIVPAVILWSHIIGAGFLRGIGFTMSVLSPC